MPDIQSEIQSRAAALADDIASGLQHGRALEWVEERIATELLEAMRIERERCAALADSRADMWEASLRRYAAGSWPAEATVEARERRKEALSLGDAIRVGPG